MIRRRCPGAVGVVAALLAVVLLGGCGGDSDAGSDATGAASATGGSTDAGDGGTATAGGSADGSDGGSDGVSEGATATAGETPYLPVPAGVTLSAQGSELALGAPASVAWQPTQKTVGVLDVTVTALERTTFTKSFVGWKLDEATRATTPYFVRATITNTGESDLGGKRVPLYIVDGTNTLIEASSFASKFAPCPSTPFFPKTFAAGATEQACLVFLAPAKGDLTAVSFRPTQEFNPITWTGEVTQAKKAKGGGGSGSGGSGGQGSAG